jgi:hypothetical protein
MKRLLLGLLLLGCGDDDGDEPEGCAALSLEACEDDATCAVLELRPWDESSGCWKSASFAACVPARATCSVVSGCLSDGDGQTWLSDGDCAPDGWQRASGAKCSGVPHCA